MLHAVFITTKEWVIQSFLSCSPELPLQAGQDLADLVAEGATLREDGGSRRSLRLTFPALGVSLPAVIRCYEAGNLVMLVHCTSDADLLETAQLYDRAAAWGKDRLQGLFRSEYYMIQQLNNQLVDSQRSLARTNGRLKQALAEIEQNNIDLEKARKTAENAMHLAEDASRSKSAFLASMSHDIRTPMNAIVGLTQLMQHTVHDPEKTQNYLTKLQETSEHLLGLLNDILDISKIESGAVTMRRDPLDLAEQLRQIEAVIRPQAQAHGHTLTIETDGICHTHFFGDATRLRQILLNFLSNSVKYTPDGGAIRFCAEETADAANHTAYCFTVQDNGIGMSAEYLKHIFEPFSRSDDSQRSGIQGTGLGMAITKNFVELMGGTLTVQSAPGQGSTFVFVLPVTLDEEAERAAAQQARTTPDNDEVPISGLRGMKLLCAEDNALNAEILQTLLDMAGVECTLCPDGRQLVDTYAKAPAGTYDAILTDIQMPVLDGYGAVREIRRSGLPGAAEIPIIAMTANVFAEDIQKCLDAGMNAHISKPVDLAVLETTLQKVRKATH